MHSRQSPTRVTAAARRAEALRLRAAGKPYREIARVLGIGEASAWKLVKREFDRLNAATRETAHQVRQLELDRLDALHEALWPSAKSGNTQAIFAALRIMERRAKLLGLDAPTKLGLEGANGEITTEDIIVLALSPKGYGAVPGSLSPEAYLERKEAERLAATQGVEPMSETDRALPVDADDDSDLEGETEDGDN
ncbi:MAG: helix-turn-helix domain-containing protein [Candidatus Hydrogenedentes bacterium]|nr:helix-turn-helix domain-containing protein [Candidatus Hydrogenedentota bacterium]